MGVIRNWEKRRRSRWFNLSDEALVERWSENVLWQYFVSPEQPRIRTSACC